MIITTTENIPNREIVTILGIARGSTVRSKHVGHDIMAGLKSIIGGELEEYTRLQAEARDQALSRMIEDAKKENADAVVNVRFITSVIMGGASEIMVYGTAVKLK
jgi:uncharacterized protein YbjQ (UPF0145 family)